MTQPSAPPRDPTAVLGRRFAAFAIDLFFLAVIGVILLAIAKHHSYYEAPSDACSLIDRSDSSICLQISDRLYVWEREAYTRAALLGGLAGFLDLVVLQTLTGASIGKLCVGLRVVEVQGNEARFLRVLGRWLFLIVDLGCFVVGLVTTLVTHPHRRVGDLVCGTYVVGVASVGRPVVVSPPPSPAFGATPAAYRAPPGAPVPPGWGTPAPWAGVSPPATIATPPGTSPTTPGEWGAVARPGPALVRSPQWQAPPADQPVPPDQPVPADQPVPVARDTMAPQWATPPGPQPADEAEPGQHAVAEPVPAPQAAPEPLAAVPQWSPVVPRTTTDSSNAGSPDAIQPPPPPPAPWSPIVPAANGDPPPAPTEPSPPPPTEPPPPPPAEPPPAAANLPDPVAAEPDDDVPWWDADS